MDSALRCAWWPSSVVSRISTCWPGRCPCQVATCSRRLFTRGVSTPMSRTSASCHSSRRPRMAAVSITVISLLFPGVAVNAKSSMTARFHPSCMMSRRVGDEIELGGPIGGYFNWSPEDGGPVLLIGGGSGVVPFMSMLRHRAPVGSQVQQHWCSQHDPARSCCSLMNYRNWRRLAMALT
jgi:hypothetical protein